MIRLIHVAFILFAFVSTAQAQITNNPTAPTTITPTTFPTLTGAQYLSSDQNFAVTPDHSRVVYVDNAGHLWSVGVDGTNPFNLSGNGDGATNRLLVITTAPSQFAIAKNGTSYDVYFQARPTTTSFGIFFYKVPIDGSTAPTQLFRITKPFSQVLPNLDGSKIYLAGVQHSLYDVASKTQTTLVAQPVVANQFKLSKDGLWSIYLVQGATANTYELRALDVLNNKEKTLLQGFDQMNGPLYDISADDSWVVVQKSSGGLQSLVLLSLQGNQETPLYPTSGPSVSASFDYATFLPGTRSDGTPGDVDPGRILFSVNQNSVRTLYVADLVDFSVTKLGTGEAINETLSSFSVLPDGKTVLYQRSPMMGIPAGPSNRTYLLDLNTAGAQPVFLFQSTNTRWSYSSANGGIVIFVGSGAYNDLNQIISVSLDGKISTRLSTAFPAGWLAPNENVTQTVNAGTRTLFTIQNPSSSSTSPGLVGYQIVSFVPSAAAARLSIKSRVR